MMAMSFDRKGLRFDVLLELVLGHMSYQAVRAVPR